MNMPPLSQQTGTSTGKVHTVLGPVDPLDLGITLTHEHLLVDFRYLFEEPEDAETRKLAHAPISIDTLGWVRFNWNRCFDNLALLDEAVTIAELSRFRRLGGRTVVDATSLGIGRDPDGLVRIARATGLHIVMGSGYYLAPTHPADLARRPGDAIADEIVRDLSDGLGQQKVRAGIIGEIGCSWPWTDPERKVARAAAQAQRRTGAPLMIHPGRNERAPMEIVHVLDAAGADLSRTIICHIERTFQSLDRLEDLARTGVYLEYDLFGHEVSHYPFGPGQFMPSDGQRVEQITWLIERGFLHRILLAHDICFRHRLARYGGHGWGHMLENVVPRMRQRGITDAQITMMLVGNPARALTLTAPQRPLPDSARGS